MRVHIETISTTKAATELLALFGSMGGQWVVHAFGSEGYVTGMLGTRPGDALLKYGTDESLAGVFDGSVPEKVLAKSLAAARKSYTDIHGGDEDKDEREIVDRRGAWRTEEAYVPMHVMAESIFRDKGPMDTWQLAESLKCSWSTAKNAAKVLRDSGKIAEIGKRPRADGVKKGAQRSIYALAEFARAA